MSRQAAGGIQLCPSSSVQSNAISAASAARIVSVTSHARQSLGSRKVRIPASYVLNANPVKSRRQPDSQPTPSKSASKPCGSGGRTVNRRNSISPQSRSGGAGGMQTSYEGEHRSIDRGRGVGTRVGMGGRPSLSSGTGLRSPSLDGGRPSSPSPSGAESSEHAKSASETKATSRIRSIGAIVRSFALTIKPRSGCAVNGCRQTGGGV